MRLALLTRITLPFGVWLALSLASFGYAADRAPLPVSNRNPLAQIFGLPSLGTAVPLGESQRLVELTYGISSFSYYHTLPDRSLVLDGEVHRLDLRFAWGTRYGEWGVELPYVAHDPGILDRFIRRWHDVFGLPGGGREQVPDGLLRYHYTKDGVERFNVTHPSEGLGDIRLYGAWKAAQALTTDIGVRVSIKLPTGDAAALRGSGATDTAAWFVIGCSRKFCDGPWAWHGSAGVLRLGRSDLLPDEQRHRVVFGGAGLHWHPLDRLTLKADLYSHGPLYRGTGFRPMESGSTQVFLGVAWSTEAGTVIDIGLSEDLHVNTAPDVGIIFSVKKVF
jgi:hypothetical protein